MQGLEAGPGVSFPMTYDTGVDGKLTQSGVTSDDLQSPVTGYVNSTVAVKGTGGLAIFSAFQTLEGALNLAGGFTVGILVSNGTARFTTDPYPPLWKESQLNK